MAAALGACAVLSAVFRYLPMDDLPQHYAMVSILVHRGDPAWGFAQRYTTDFLGRPYATVYWLGAALAYVMPLGAAMRIVVATCTVAPLAGAYALLAATKRPRAWVLAAVPFAFGRLWHWGFLNFLLGTGMFLAGLGLVIVAAERPGRRVPAALGVLGVVLLFTHFHGLAMLLLFAPVFVWAWADAREGRKPYVRALGPLVPSALAAVAFVLVTWAQAQGRWMRLNPDLGERVQRLPEFLAAGLPDPWPEVWLVAFGVVALAGVLLGGAWPHPRRALIALGIAFAAQIAMYLVLPLNTNTATFVSGRHALLVVLLALPLLPELDGARGHVVRALGASVALAALFVTGRHLACFDREAHEFDPILAAMQPARRVAPLIFDRTGACVNPRTFPYLHFAAYYQAAKGGDLSRSFAVVWNVPIRYRGDYRRYALPEEVEWQPWQFSAEDARHFDYVIVRGPRKTPSQLGLREVASSGAWTLFENPDALPAELPPP